MALLDRGTHPVTGEFFTLIGFDKADIPAYFTSPENPTNALVIEPDIGGLRELFSDIADRFASHGFAVVVVEPFARFPKEVRDEMDTDERRARIAHFDDATQIGDLIAAHDWLVERTGISDAAVIGFCMGGMYTLKAATSGQFSRAVAFYGMIRLPALWRTPTHAEPLEGIEDACPTLAILGGRDAFTPEVDIAALHAAWSHRPDCEIAFYPEAEHGFAHDPDRPTHRDADAADAWLRALNFLKV